ncbi:crosslink repair DNA glycosylase YcaQ family protein [Pseudonocardia sp.]|uniref:DNA glycosylase AlkZ-like family protein n=1 Tax=Pseudonocardia sp. TaxID=60912 RepID=UPI00261C67D3|nr:crosslink repair DNA glycosylase YcaQ family protein [Pseudonocardia sp.]
MSAPELTRRAVLGHRSAVHGLDRRAGGADRVLGLGIQDTLYGSAARALAARGAAPADGAAGPLVWTWRGAPHLHRAEDLAFLARALWPVGDADATKRIATTSIRQGARRGVEAFTAAATAMRDVVTHRMSKGEVSALVSERVPNDLTYDCESCRARHISGALFQQVGLAAGVQVVPEGRSTLLEPLPEDVRPPRVPERGEGAAAALLRYVELHGPASAAHLGSFLGTTTAVAKSVVQAMVTAGAPAGLVEVSGPGGPGWMTPDALDRARDAEPLRATRLLPPSDPWLQARDREVVVPDAARRKVVWRAIGNAGAVLADGEVVGVWRSAAQRGGQLTVTVEAFEPLAAGRRDEIDAEAQLLAAPGSGTPPVQVAFAA